MQNTYDAIVLGLGGIGSAALYWLSRRLGQNVLGLEQFELGHSNGGSQDHSRIIRLSYHTPQYVALAKEAYAAWATVEEEVQEPLIVKTGGLDLSPPNAAIPIVDYISSMQTEHVSFEELNDSEIMYRWPQFRLEDDLFGLYQAESGIAPAARCNAAHIRLARQYGAQIRNNASVTQIHTVSGVNDEVEVIVDQTPLRCHHLIITAGAWTNHHLAHFGIQLPLTVTKEQVTYYASPNLAEYSPNRFPIWIWMDEPCYYGFPIYGENGPKVAQDVGGQKVTPETRTFERDEVAFQRVDHFVKSVLPTAHGEPIYTKTCLYTMPPDRDFIIDALPQASNVTIAIGAGHAFKFASQIGKILSELTLDGETRSDIAGFDLRRIALWEENPVKNFVI